MPFKKSCDFMLCDHVFSLSLFPHPRPTLQLLVCLVCLCFVKLEFGKGRKAVELVDKVTYFRVIPCVKSTYNIRSTLRSCGGGQMFG